MPDRIEVVVAGRDRASGRRDVAVIEPDAVVDERCIEKLQRCASSDPGIGTAVPWTAQTLAPGHNDACVVDGSLDRSAPRVYPEAHDASAPCIFVRGAVLRRIGGREALGNRARLVERVREEGYRNVLCDDAFAARRGEEACAQGAPRDAVPIARLLRTQAAIAAGEGKPGILHILHPRGGGTEKYVQSIVRATRDRYRHYFLRIADDHWLWKDAAGEHRAACRWPRDASGESSMRTMCAWLAIDFVHVHSLVGTGDEFLRMLASTHLPYAYSVHDMYPACPTVYLIGATASYCGATTDLAACRACLAQVPALRGVDIAQWRERYAAFVNDATVVWAPSRWAGETLHKYYPGGNVEVRPHPVDLPRLARPDADAFALPRDGARHVAVLGAIGPEKGARNIDALAEEIRARALPLRIVVVGFTDRARHWQSDDRVLTIHGSYGEDELPALFRRYRIDVSLFPTLWPETFSYTLSELWGAGCPALVPPGGALAERVEATGAGWILHGWPSVRAMADQLCAITSDEGARDLAARAELARAAAAMEARGSTTAPYDGLVRASARPVADAPTVRAIYEAACRALGVEPLPAPVSGAAASGASALDRLRRLVRRG
ncbi:MAG: glycosyltransferase [Burkholderiales bacterium]